MTTTQRHAGREASIRLLYVDDDPQFRELVEAFIGERHDGLAVETVETGEAVLDRLAAGGIDCVVSDFQMPRMDGVALLDAVRESHPDLPFILFTGQGGEAIAADAVSAGVTDYIRKATDPDQFGLLANRVRNLVERHRARVQYRDVFDSSSEAILVIDAEAGTVVDANRRARELWGYSAAEFDGIELDALLAGPSPADPEAGTAASRSAAGAGTIDRVLTFGEGPIDGQGGAASGGLAAAGRSVAGFAAAAPDETQVTEWRCEAADGSSFWGAVSLKQATIDGRARLLAIVRDVSRRKTRQRQLDGLLHTVQHLLTVQSEGEIAAAAVEAATDTLRFADATVYLLGEDGTGFRRPREASPADALDEPAALEEADALWDALDRGSVVAADDADGEGVGVGWSSPEDHRSAGPGPDAPGRLYVPLGELGVVRAVAGPATDAHDVDLLSLLATFAAGAFDRAKRESVLRDREAKVRSQRDELLALNHVNEVIRDINQALVSVSSREGIEGLVCEKFVATDRYSFAWIGEHDPTAQAVVPTSSAGRGEGFLPDRIPVGADEAYPIAAAVADRAVTVVDRLTPETVPPERYRRAREHGFRSVAYVPVVHQNVLYRLLAVYADEPNAFGPRETAVFGELGETIGHAMAAAEWRSGRIAETVVELEVAVDHDAGLFRLSADTPAEIELREMEELGDGSIRVYAVVAGATFEALEAAVAEVSALDEIVHLGEDAGAIRLSYLIRSGPLRRAVSTAGITLGRGTIADGSGTFQLTVPGGTDVRWVVDQFDAAFDAAELVGRRDRHRSEPGGGHADLVGSLTDRQQEVLRTAYHAGYFERPRRATGTDVAAALGIAQPTFNEHVRAAECRVIEALLAR